MAYEKHTWETGETITAEKLNNLEDGVASAGDGSGDSNEFIINVSRDSQYNLVIDKTFDEVEAAYNNGKTLKLKNDNTNYRFYEKQMSMGGIDFTFVSDNISIPFFLESATSITIYVGCFIVSSNLNEPLRYYDKDIILTFS